MKSHTAGMQIRFIKSATLNSTRRDVYAVPIRKCLANQRFVIEHLKSNAETGSQCNGLPSTGCVEGFHNGSSFWTQWDRQSIGTHTSPSPSTIFHHMSPIKHPTPLMKQTLKFTQIVAGGSKYYLKGTGHRGGRQRMYWAYSKYLIRGWVVIGSYSIHVPGWLLKWLNLITAPGSVSNEPGSVTWLATKYLKTVSWRNHTEKLTTWWAQNISFWLKINIPSSYFTILMLNCLENTLKLQFDSYVTAVRFLT